MDQSSLCGIIHQKLIEKWKHVATVCECISVNKWALTHSVSFPNKILFTWASSASGRCDSRDFSRDSNSHMDIFTAPSSMELPAAREELQFSFCMWLSARVLCLTCYVKTSVFQRDLPRLTFKLRASPPCGSCTPSCVQLSQLKQPEARSNKINIQCLIQCIISRNTSN